MATPVGARSLVSWPVPHPISRIRLKPGDTDQTVEVSNRLDPVPRLGPDITATRCGQISPGSGRERTAQLGVAARARKAQHSIHSGHRELGLVRLDELEACYGVEPLSLANQAAAFLRIPPSCSRIRNRVNSWRSSQVIPSARPPWSRSACLIQ